MRNELIVDRLIEQAALRGKAEERTAALEAFNTSKDQRIHALARDNEALGVLADTQRKEMARRLKEHEDAEPRLNELWEAADALCRLLRGHRALRDGAERRRLREALNKTAGDCAEVPF